MALFRPMAHSNPLWWPSLWRKTCKQNNFCVGVVWQTQSIVQHLFQTKKN